MKRAMVGCVVLCGLACRVSPAPETGLPDTAAAHASWTAADVASEWARLAQLGLPSPNAIRDAVSAAIAMGDEDCPGSDTENLVDPPVSLSGCTSAGGILYAGELVWQEEEGEGRPGWLNTSFGTQVADFVIEYPDGERISGGGRLYLRRAESDKGAVVITTTVNGTWSHNRSEKPWLETGISSYLEMQARAGADAVGVRYAVSGTYGVGDIAAYFEQLGFGSGCDTWPSSGAVSLRASDGTWYRMDFFDHTACDACAEVIWQGQHALGEACPDFAGLLAWLDEGFLTTH
jgi:hypothetical protein